MGLRDVSWAKRSGKGFIIPSSRIRVGPWGNTRTYITPEMIDTRAKSLIEEGQKKAVKGLISEDGEWFELLDGELRLLGWKEAKKTYGTDLDKRDDGIYCEIEEGFSAGGKVRYPSTVEAIKIHLFYGTDSEPLSQYDKAKAVSKLVESGEKVSSLAIIMHCSEQHVRDLLLINSVPNQVKENVKPSTAAKFARASVPTQKKVIEKISSGEKVKGKDVQSKAETREQVSDDTVPLPAKDQHRMSDEEIQALIKKADRFMCGEKTNGRRERWQYFIRACRMILGHEVSI
ncbi:MAG: hypothetical protein M0R06_08490 [Sphaerochaeta sp.]|jgi:hypothetical protein|nr:hypothetical protein [Sphaerochaeta sp.]